MNELGQQIPSSPAKEPKMDRSDFDYQTDLIIKFSEIQRSDIEKMFLNMEMDEREKEYWKKKFETEFDSNPMVAEKLNFFALLSKMSEEEKVQLYHFSMRCRYIPGIHDFRSHFLLYLQLFPNEQTWWKKARLNLL